MFCGEGETIRETLKGDHARFHEVVQVDNNLHLTIVICATHLLQQTECLLPSLQGVRTQSQQTHHHLLRPVPGCDGACRPPGVVEECSVRPSLDQAQCSLLSWFAVASVHQRRPSLDVLQIHSCASVNKRFDDLGICRLGIRGVGGEHERCVALAVGCIGIGALTQQQLHDFQMSLPGCHLEQRQVIHGSVDIKLIVHLGADASDISQESQHVDPHLMLLRCHSRRVAFLSGTVSHDLLHSLFVRHSQQLDGDVKGGRRHLRCLGA
mmetsp:Transcript_75070/g.176240  ORF Transcript_75070/g.176240 Transcript_75070/m.176240 type:complete len:266 (+) Transcript_75070:1119-1916(+)